MALGTTVQAGSGLPTLSSRHLQSVGPRHKTCPTGNSMVGSVLLQHPSQLFVQLNPPLGSGESPKLRYGEASKELAWCIWSDEYRAAAQQPRTPVTILSSAESGQRNPHEQNGGTNCLEAVTPLRPLPLRSQICFHTLLATVIKFLACQQAHLHACLLFQTCLIIACSQHEQRHAARQNTVPRRRLQSRGWQACAEGTVAGSHRGIQG